MISKLIALASLPLAFAAPEGSAFHWGHAAYTYGPMKCSAKECDVVPSCNRAGWAKDIAAYNEKTNDTTAQISMVFSYGGDIEFWHGKKNKTGCHKPASTDPKVCNISVYYDPNNLKAAEVYSNASGVKAIVSLLDSRMDGWNQITTYNGFDKCNFSDFYPDLNNLTNASFVKLAADTTKLYCAENNDIMDGMQVDLEPYKPQYRESLRSYLKLVAENLLDEKKETGCRNDKHPNGRTVSYFTFAHNHHANFSEVLGPNGHYVFSLYDLFPKNGTNSDGGFMFNTPEEFADNIRKEITYFRGVVGDKVKFQLALPVGASCHEYEEYRPMSGKGCGPACKPLVSNSSMVDYVKQIFNVLLDPKVTEATKGLFCMSEENDSQFLGIGWWSFSYQMSYPPMKWFDNEFLPASPSEDALALLRENLPKFQNGVTCTKDKWVAPEPIFEDRDGCRAERKENTCMCNFHQDCASNWCDLGHKKCSPHPHGTEGAFHVREARANW